jgi:hypothetical protein
MGATAMTTDDHAYWPPKGVPEPIPSGVYYNPEADNFYLDNTCHGMGLEFYREWRNRRNEFPTPPTKSI